MVDFRTRDVSQYPSGVAANVGLCRFIVTADDERLTDYLGGYLFHKEQTVQTVHSQPWEVLCQQVSTLDLDGLRLMQHDGVVVVKPGFSYRRYRDGATQFYVTEEGFDTHPHAVARTNNKLHYLYVELNELALRVPLRLMREVLLRTMENAGGIFVHSAFVSVGERGYMICGDSGSGKTTCLTKILSLPDARFIANDRGIAIRQGEGYRYVGWPLAVRIGAGTARMLPCFSSMAGAFSRSENENIVGLSGDEIFGWGNPTKYELTPFEFTSLARCGGAMDAPISAMIFPSLSLCKRPMMWEKTNHETGRSTLRRNIYSPSDEEYGKGWLGLRSISDSALHASAERFITWASRLPMHTLSGDPSVFDTSHFRGLDLATI